MKNLLYKEFTLAVHPLYLAAGLLFGALAMIPQWIYLLIPLYFCFVSVPNLLGQYKANKDNQFTALLPVPRADTVAARILTFVILETLHVIGMLIFAFIHHAVYDLPNFGLDLNGAYFGVVLLIYGVLNLLLFPLYYKTAEKFGLPVIVSVGAAVLLAGAVEVLAAVSGSFQRFMEQRQDMQVLLPVAGLLFFVGASYLAYRVSARRFEYVEL